MITKNYFACAALCFAATISASANGIPTINEVMQSNVNSLFVDYDYPDSWVELYNPTDAAIDLSGWKIGVKEKASKGYDLSAVGTLEPGKFAVIYCDKVGEGLHASFRVDSSKSSLYLFDPTGKIVETVELEKMLAPDLSYGRTTDGGDTWSWFPTSTPGQTNKDALKASSLLGVPVFSIKGGIVSANTEVTISLPKDAPEGAKLLVTTNGREPSSEDVVAIPYTIDIKESTPVRAKLMADGYLSPLSTTHTYLVNDFESPLGIICLTVDPDDFYSDERGMLSSGKADGETYNYLQEWRRPINVEMFGTDDDRTEIINQIGETAIMGHSSRNHPQRSLKIYANKRFGTKQFTAELFPEDKPGLKQFPSFCIRNSGSVMQTNHIIDAFMHRLFGKSTDNKLDYQAYRPVMAYINGKPYGLIDLRERSNTDHIESNYDIEDVAMVENWAEFENDESEELFRKLASLYNNPSTSFEQIEEVVDIDSFAACLIADDYGFNLDTPGNNKIMWTPLDNIKWRWFIKDMDCTANTYVMHLDYADFLTRNLGEMQEDWFGNQEWALGMHKKMLSLSKFTDRMIDLFVAYYGDFLLPSRTTRLLDEMVNETKAEFANLASIYGFEDNRESYIEKIREFLEKRPEYMFSHLISRYNLGKTVPLFVDNESDEVSLNGHKIVNKTFDGLVFAGREIKLNGNNGSWKIMAISPSGEETEVAKSANAEISFTPADNADVASYRAVYTADSGIDDITTGGEFGEAEWYTLEGLRMNHRPSEPGLYIRRCGTKSQKIMIKR